MILSLVRISSAEILIFWPVLEKSAYFEEYFPIALVFLRITFGFQIRFYFVYAFHFPLIS